MRRPIPHFSRALGTIPILSIYASKNSTTSLQNIYWFPHHIRHQSLPPTSPPFPLVANSTRSEPPCTDRQFKVVPAVHGAFPLPLLSLISIHIPFRAQCADRKVPNVDLEIYFHLCGCWLVFSWCRKWLGGFHGVDVACQPCIMCGFATNSDRCPSFCSHSPNN